MQKTTVIVLSSLSLILSVANAEARNTKRSTTKATTTSSEQIETHQSAPEHHSSSSVSYDLGISSIFPVITTGISGVSSNNGSLTAILHFTNLDAVQILAGVATTNGGFGFGVGGIYKRTVLGNESAGIHLGGGFGLGTVATGTNLASSTNFAMSIPAVVGAHFEIPGTQLAFHFDGGPVFSLISVSGTNGVGGTTVTNFSMAPLSTLLGASVVYQF